MKKYSSSTIGYFNNYCPAALGFYEKDTPYDISQMAYGVASHAVLEAIGNKGATSDEEKRATSEAVVRRLITEGRTFRGRHEPPMKPDHAFLGRDVALKWLEFNEFPEGGEYEIELAAVLPGQNYKIVALHDLIWSEEESDECSSKITAISRDWKGWQGTEAELETIQRKAQAVTLLHRHPSVEEIRLEVCNLQTHQIFSKTIVLDEEGLSLIEQWANDLNTVCHAVDQTREARPGVGCLSCPYNHVCKDRMIAAPHDTEDYEKLSLYLVGLETERTAVIKMLKANAELPVDIEGGYVGWKLHPNNKVAKDAHQKVIDAWLGENFEFISKESFESLISALNLGISNINSVAKVLYGKEDDAMKEDFLDSCIEKRNRRLFGVWKGK